VLLTLYRWGDKSGKSGERRGNLKPTSSSPIKLFLFTLGLPGFQGSKGAMWKRKSWMRRGEGGEDVLDQSFGRNTSFPTVNAVAD